MPVHSLAWTYDAAGNIPAHLQAIEQPGPFLGAGLFCMDDHVR